MYIIIFFQVDSFLFLYLSPVGRDSLVYRFTILEKSLFKKTRRDIDDSIKTLPEGFFDATSALTKLYV